MKAPSQPVYQNGVSIVVCTKRAECMENLFANYKRQTCRNKELIIILNHPGLNPDTFRKAAKPYRNVRIYSLPGHTSLGKCLNYAISVSRRRFIAKFDDDDYYAPAYLTESMATMRRTKADIVGKRAHFMILGGKKLLYRYYTLANKPVTILQGATLLIKRHVLKQVSFPDRNRGECVKFCADCAAKGFRIYAGSPYNFIAIRKRNSRNHTWIVSDKHLLSKNVKVLRMRNIRRFVNRS